MAKRDEIVKYLSDILRSTVIPDGSQNGLQVEGKDTVRRAAFAVSANKKTFDMAIAKGADIIITHHGLIWDHPFIITGVNKKRVEILIKNDVNLAAWHLPLDMHPVYGNNASICKLLGLKNLKPFGKYKGMDIGFCGVFSAPKKFEDIAKTLGAKTPFNFAGKKIKSAAVVSGGAHMNFFEAADKNIDLFITGSADELIQEYARESGCAFMAIGHYNSETYGVKNLMALVKKKFKIETFFIDVPNNL